MTNIAINKGNDRKGTPSLRLISRSRTAACSKRSHNTSLKLASVSEASEYIGEEQEKLILEYRTKARKLGRSMLRKWNCRLDLEEVDSLVDLSLCEAVQRFDAAKGASFMTFLFYHLKGNLVKAVRTSIDIAAIPSSFAAMIDGEAGDENIRELGLNAVDLAGQLSGEETQTPDEKLWKKQLSGCSVEACQKLDPLEREIIKRIFVHEQQIIDIAAALGYSRCHISRVKKKALSTLHDELAVNINQDDYGFVGQVGPEIAEVKNRIAERKVTHRRKSKTERVDSDYAEAQAEAA